MVVDELFIVEPSYELILDCTSSREGGRDGISLSTFRDEPIEFADAGVLVLLLELTLWQLDVDEWLLDEESGVETECAILCADHSEVIDETSIEVHEVGTICDTQTFGHVPLLGGTLTFLEQGGSLLLGFVEVSYR